MRDALKKNEDARKGEQMVNISTPISMIVTGWIIIIMAIKIPYTNEVIRGVTGLVGASCSLVGSVLLARLYFIKNKDIYKGTIFQVEENKKDGEKKCN